MKWVSNRISGVKNFVSITGLLRGLPLSQLKSPYANGVTLSTPGVASGACKASGRAGAGGAAAGPSGGAGGAGDSAGTGSGSFAEATAGTDGDGAAAPPL